MIQREIKIGHVTHPKKTWWQFLNTTPSKKQEADEQTKRTTREREERTAKRRRSDQTCHCSQIWHFNLQVVHHGICSSSSSLASTIFRHVKWKKLTDSPEGLGNVTEHVAVNKEDTGKDDDDDSGAIPSRTIVRRGWNGYFYRKSIMVAAAQWDNIRDEWTAG